LHLNDSSQNHLKNIYKLRFNFCGKIWKANKLEFGSCLNWIRQYAIIYHKADCHVLIVKAVRFCEFIKQTVTSFLNELKSNLGLGILSGLFVSVVWQGFGWMYIPNMGLISTGMLPELPGLIKPHK